MSQTPNNPFDTQPNQFGGQPQPSEPSGGSKTWLWVLGILGGVFLIGAMVCCGVVWYGSSQFSGFVADAAMQEFRDDPVVVEHIGEIESSEMDFGEAISASSEEPNMAVMVFHVKGNKGSGKILHRTNQQTNEISAVLIMDDGTEYPMEVNRAFDDVASELEGFEDFEEMENPEDTLELELEPIDELTPAK